jgi:hypothetical protein
LSITAFDDTATKPSTTTDDRAGYAMAVAAVIAVAVAALIYTFKEWEEVGGLRTLSRSFVLFGFVLGVGAISLYFLRGGEMDINGCQVVADAEICRREASPQEVLGMLAWHAADVVPVLEINESLEWRRPARSNSAVAGATILMVRLWVAVGILGLIKRAWDEWGLHGSGQ